MSKEQQGGSCGWSRESEGERKEVKAGMLLGEVMQASWATGRSWTFILREVGVLGAFEQRRDGT